MNKQDLHMFHRRKTKLLYKSVTIEVGEGVRDEVSSTPPTPPTHPAIHILLRRKARGKSMSDKPIAVSGGIQKYRHFEKCCGSLQWKEVERRGLSVSPDYRAPDSDSHCKPAFITTTTNSLIDHNTVSVSYMTFYNNVAFQENMAARRHTKINCLQQ